MESLHYKFIIKTLCISCIIIIVSLCVGFAGQVNIQLQVKIMEYSPDDLHFTYSDGRFEWFDSTKLKILQPDKFKGELCIFHSGQIPKDSPWRKIGNVYYMTIDAALLEPEKRDSQHIFSDTIMLNHKM